MMDPGARSPRIGLPSFVVPHDDVPQALASETAPLFDVSVGSRTARAAKRLANLVLAAPLRPQRFFNTGVRVLVGRWARVLRTLLEGQAVLAAQLELQRSDLARLAAEVAELRGRPSALLPRVALGTPVVGYWYTAPTPRAGVAVAADVARLPFRPAALDELLVAADAVRQADTDCIAGWYDCLRPDGRLRCMPPLGIADDLVARLAQIGFDAFALEPAVGAPAEVSFVARRPAT